MEAAYSSHHRDFNLYTFIDDRLTSGVIVAGTEVRTHSAIVTTVEHNLQGNDTSRDSGGMANHPTNIQLRPGTGLTLVQLLLNTQYVANSLLE